MNIVVRLFGAKTNIQKHTNNQSSKEAKQNKTKQKQKPKKKRKKKESALIERSHKYKLSEYHIWSKLDEPFPKKAAPKVEPKNPRSRDDSCYHGNGLQNFNMESVC